MPNTTPKQAPTLGQNAPLGRADHGITAWLTLMALGGLILLAILAATCS